ncbi:MAG: sugar transferase [Clostridiales bacterium]|nr:sugar transferase [Clostridiales bacterium]
MRASVISQGHTDVELNEEALALEHPIYTVEQVQTGGGPCYRFFKRLFDISASLLMGIVLFVPMLVIALLVKLDSPGPALFQQERLGWHGVPFMMYKFRSMRLDAEASGPRWAERNDARCTRLGRLLRRTRLDELPQLINILKGEMSFVGPRPERAFFYDKFERYIGGFRNRLAVKPGLTGYAQVHGGYELRPEEKIQYDMAYIRGRCVQMDLDCILRTAALVFTREGAR